MLLRALSGRLHPIGDAQYEGDVYYNGDNIKSDKFLVRKVADYIEQGDTHEAVLTVEETLRFAWKCTTGGKNSYARAKDEESAAILDDVEKHAYTMVENMVVALGLKGCKDTVVGNGKIRGVSGGQKRRVTIGELFVCPRHVRMQCLGISSPLHLQF